MKSLLNVIFSKSPNIIATNISHFTVPMYVSTFYSTDVCLNILQYRCMSQHFTVPMYVSTFYSTDVCLNILQYRCMSQHFTVPMYDINILQYRCMSQHIYSTDVCLNILQYRCMTQHFTGTAVCLNILPIIWFMLTVFCMSQHFTRQCWLTSNCDIPIIWFMLLFPVFCTETRQVLISILYGVFCTETRHDIHIIWLCYYFLYSVQRPVRCCRTRQTDNQWLSSRYITAGYYQRTN